VKFVSRQRSLEGIDVFVISLEDPLKKMRQTLKNSFTSNFSWSE
jgi:hypothetical protein